jgi:hypothetical protein
MAKQKALANITDELLFGLINVLVPEEPGQYVRPGSVADGAAWFNPQPDPPGVAILPDPRRARIVSRSVISTAVLALSSAANESEGLRGARSMLGAFIDDFCGTVPRRRLVLPPPWPRFDKKANALEVIVAGAQFHSASQALKDHPLGKDLADGAQRLLQAALQRLAR